MDHHHTHLRAGDLNEDGFPDFIIYHPTHVSGANQSILLLSKKVKDHLSTSGDNSQTWMLVGHNINQLFIGSCSNPPF